MRHFTLYGLSCDDRVLAYEKLSEVDAKAIDQALQERFARYPKVELWEGVVRILKKSRTA